MSLKEDLSTELKIAMKESNTDVKRVIRMVIASVKNLEIDKGKLLNDDEVISIIHKEIKSRNEVIDGARLSNRQDLINEAENDIKILNRFLPEGLSHEELKKIVQETIVEVNAISISDMGKVMKLVLPKIGGRASGNEVSQIVRELINN
ncbi:MAG: GatB/YqeY domain-containing protein [Anaerolineaceae bacterium]|nr:GatB/YqeY domain-containing protein [Anaerolineaceae bacterium]